MTDPSGLRFRTARPEDAHAIARLHADSWQRGAGHASSGTTFRLPAGTLLG
jgi:hypothetical protein